MLFHYTRSKLSRTRKPCRRTRRLTLVHGTLEGEEKLDPIHISAATTAQ